MATANTRRLARTMLVPSVAALFIWMIVPLALTLWYSFQIYNLLNPINSGFAGWSNYYYFLTDPSFFQAFGNTLILTVSVLAITVIGGILLGMLLDQAIFGQGIVRILVISPVLHHADGRRAGVEEHAARSELRHLRLDHDALRHRADPVAGKLSAVFRHRHRVVGVAAVCDAHPVDGAAVARRGAQGSGGDGRGQLHQHVRLHRAAAPGARHHRRDPDRDDLPARRCSPRFSSRPAAVRATPRPTSPISIYHQALLDYDVGGASAGGVVAVILANIVAIFLVRIVGKNLDA